MSRPPAWPVGVVLAFLITACSGSSAPPAATAIGPVGAGAATPGKAHESLLLRAADVPGLTLSAASASSAATTQAAPQLALCTTPKPVGAHTVTSVLARPAAPGKAQVFELVSVFADASAARGALAAAEGAARGCASYRSGDLTFRVADLNIRPVAGATGTLQYRLVASDVVAGDVRTLVQRGPYLVMLSGFGAPPAGETALAFQARVAAKALSRLP